MAQATKIGDGPRLHGDSEMGEESAESQVTPGLPTFPAVHLEFVEKARNLYNVATRKGLPDHLFQHPDDAEKTASQLQLAGQSNLTRLLWYFLYHQKEHSDNLMKWCSNMIMADVIGRYVVQTEVHESEMLRSKRKELQLCTLPEERATIESVIRRTKRTLENTNDIYRRLYRTLWELQEHMPSGPLRRAFWLGDRIQIVTYAIGSGVNVPAVEAAAGGAVVVARSCATRAGC